MTVILLSCYRESSFRKEEFKNTYTFRKEHEIMKKKLLSCVFATVLAFSASTSAFAESITEDGGSQSKDVQGVYEEMDKPDIVYKVDVAWGNMEFVYNAATIKKTWDPSTHTYKEETPEVKGSWSNDLNSNKVTVTNHSNKALTATVSAQIKQGFEGISAYVDSAILILSDASIGATDVVAGTPTTGDAIITLSGALEAGTTDKTQIGSVTVTIADK